MKKGTKPPTLSPNLEKVRDRFAIWRSRKKPSSRIPKALWQAAIESCESDSVLQVSKVLRLNYNELKERVRAVEKTRGPLPKKQGSAFMELGFVTSSSEFTLEIEAPNGAKMKVRYKGTVDPLTLCKAFWGEVS